MRVPRIHPGVVNKYTGGHTLLSHHQRNTMCVLAAAGVWEENNSSHSCRCSHLNLLKPGMPQVLKTREEKRAENAKATCRAFLLCMCCWCWLAGVQLLANWYGYGGPIRSSTHVLPFLLSLSLSFFFYSSYHFKRHLNGNSGRHVGVWKRSERKLLLVKKGGGVLARLEGALCGF
jgi:hypothetical protein